jgi:phenylacetate-CoA ligase
MAGVAPTAHLLDDPEGQGKLLPQLLEATEQLHRGSAHPIAELNAALPWLTGALWRSPYYLRTLKPLALSPSDLRSIDDLSHFPTLDRRTLAAHWRDLTSESTDPGSEWVVVNSSGSTGRPVKVLRTRYDCIHMWAVLRFWCDRLGVVLPPNPRVALLCALPGGLEYEAKVPVFHNGTLTRISTIQPNPTQRLENLAPHIVFSDPAGLHWLAGTRPSIRPLLLLSSAQHLADSLRADIRSHYTAFILDYYALTEVGAVAWKCPSDQLHVLSPDVLVESDQGELVVTRLRPGPFPILRFRTGDQGEVAFESCGCGITGSTIKGLKGRRFCQWSTPDGGTVDAWSVVSLFKHHRLDDFRLTHRGKSTFHLELAADAVDSALVQKLSTALQLMGFPNPIVTTELTRNVHQRGLKATPFLSADAEATDRCFPDTSCS